MIYLDWHSRGEVHDLRMNVGLPSGFVKELVTPLLDMLFSATLVTLTPKPVSDRQGYWMLDYALIELIGC